MMALLIIKAGITLIGARATQKAIKHPYHKYDVFICALFTLICFAGTMHTLKQIV